MTYSHRVAEYIRWTVFGQTCGGRYLIAVIALYRRRGGWKAVTARSDIADGH